MVPSAVFNEAILFLTVIAMIGIVRRTPREELPANFRYFTVLSNLFCAFASCLLLLAELFGAMPVWVVAIKYMGTLSVTVTFLTVFLFLLPTSKNFEALMGNPPEIIMHLATPLLAIISFLCFENLKLSAWVIPLAILPVLLYAWLYIDRVLLKRTWPDFYGFTKNGRWRLVFSFMTLGSILAAVLLWLL